MPYCRKCGTKLPEGAAYCPNCREPVEPEVALAYWGERFVAWLIDVVILGAILLPIKWLLTPVGWPAFIWAPIFLRWIPFVDLGFDSVIFFLYWTVMEGSYGQSIGKMIMKLRVTQIDGKPTDPFHAAIESLGKAFLLPIDCIIGWILYPRKRQRFFNYISGTITVRS